MLYHVHDLHHHQGGPYIDLNSIQTIIAEDAKPLAYSMTLSDGEIFEIEPKDFEALKKVLIKEGIMIPDPQESEEVLSNDPWAKDGKDSTE